MWTWLQAAGEMLHDGKRLALGYSGHGPGVNNPALEAVPRVGPIPCGRWKIIALVTRTPDHGEFVLRLAPAQGNDARGRSGFLVHGDSIKAPGTGSEGCIILPRWAREAIWNSGDRDLLVVSGRSPEVATS